MADTKISALTSAGTLAGADESVYVQGGVTKRAANSVMATYLATALAATFAAASHTHAAADITSGTMATARLGSGTANATTFLRGDQTWATEPEILIIAVGDETTAITTGTAKVTFRMPFAMTLTSVRASLTTASSSGLPTINIKENGTTILSTKITIDATELTSQTAVTAPVISDSALADDASITIDIDVAGTGAAGLKVYMIGSRA